LFFLWLDTRAPQGDAPDNLQETPKAIPALPAAPRGPDTGRPDADYRVSRTCGGLRPDGVTPFPYGISQSWKRFTLSVPAGTCAMKSRGGLSITDGPPPYPVCRVQVISA